MAKKRRNGSKPKSIRRLCREMRMLKSLKRDGIFIIKEAPKEDLNASNCTSNSQDLFVLKPQITLNATPFISDDQNTESDILSASTELEDPLAIAKTQLTSSTEKDLLRDQTQSTSRKPDIFVPLGSESLAVPNIQEEEELNPNVSKNDFGGCLTSVQGRTLSDRAAMAKKIRNANRPKSRRKICREMRKLKVLKKNGVSIQKEVPAKDLNASLAISNDVKHLKTYSRISVLKLGPYNSYDQNMEDPLAIDKIQITSTTEKDPLDLQTQSSSREPDIFTPLGSETLVVPKIEEEDEVNRNIAKNDFEQFGRFVASMLGKTSPEKAVKLQGKIVSLLLESDANS